MRQSALDDHREAIIERAKSGESLAALARAYGTGHSNMHRWLRTTEIYSQPVKCVLIECDRTFQWKPGKVACCRRHIKRFNARGNSPGQMLPCCLPECDKLVLVTDANRKRMWWCSVAHHSAHAKRVKSGYYDRVLGLVDDVCFGVRLDGSPCGERYCLDGHHVVVNGNRSDKAGPTKWLCPTHHLAIHRKLAVIDGGRYVWVVARIRAGLAAKHPQMLGAS